MIDENVYWEYVMEKLNKIGIDMKFIVKENKNCKFYSPILLNKKDNTNIYNLNGLKVMLDCFVNSNNIIKFGISKIYFKKLDGYKELASYLDSVNNIKDILDECSELFLEIPEYEDIGEVGDIIDISTIIDFCEEV